MNAFSPMDTFQAAQAGAYDQQQKFAQDRARKRAGAALVGGNYTGAAGELYGAGDLQAGQQVADYGQQQQLRDATIQGSTALARGDYTGAAAAYGRTGDAKSVLSANEAKVTEAQRELELTSKLSRAFRADLAQHAGDDPQALQTHAAALWDQATPIFQAMKADPQHLAQWKSEFVTNPKGFLDMIDAATAKIQQDYTLKQGEERRSGVTNEVVASVAPEQKYMAVPAGGALIPVPRTGAPAPVAAPEPVSGPPLAGAAPASAGGLDQILAEGKARMTSGLRSPGHNAAVGGVPDSRHLTGQAADLVPGPDMTMASLAAEVQRRMPGAKVLNEGTHVHVQWDASGGARIAAPPADGLPPGTIRGPAKPPEWSSDGAGFLRNANGDVKPDPSYLGAGGAADPSVVKMVLEGRYPAPTGRAATSPQWLAVLQAAAAQDPTFNAADYNTRFATRKDFTSGKAAQNITALNTAIGHIGDLDGQIDALGNTPFTSLNKIGNAFAKATGDPRIDRFNTTKAAVASELVRVFRQAGGTEGDIQDFQRPLDAAKSPEQLHAVTKQMIALLTSRLDAMAAQYRQGLGQDKQGVEFLTPKAQQIYTKVTGLPPPVTRSGAPAPVSGGDVVRVRTPEEAMSLPPGTVFITPDGRRKVR